MLIDTETIDSGGSWHKEREEPIAWDVDLVDFFFEQAEKQETLLVLDIGACTGSFSLLPVAHSGMTVISFEPNPVARGILNKHVSINNLVDRVTIYPYALSNYCGQAELFYPPNNVHIGLSKIGADANPDWLSVTVEVRTLDSLNIQQKVGLIKLDVEGSELGVLSGGKKLIERDLPGILFEYRPYGMMRFGYAKDDIFDFLTGLGYKKFKRIITLPQENEEICDVWTEQGTE